MLCCLQVAAQLIAHVPDANLELQGYEFCSEEIAREAFEFQRSKSVQDLEQILVELAHYPMAASMRGQLFEQYVLRVAVPQGCTVEVIDFETRTPLLSPCMSVSRVQASCASRACHACQHQLRLALF